MSYALAPTKPRGLGVLFKTKVLLERDKELHLVAESGMVYCNCYLHPSTMLLVENANLKANVVKRLCAESKAKYQELADAG